MNSPIGRLRIVVDGDVVTYLAMEDQAHLPSATTFGKRSKGCAAQAVAELDAYFAGELQCFRFATSAHGTLFQQAVWKALSNISFGQTSTYGAIAHAIGNPKAVRAVGSAIGHNPLSIVVPCHRVIGASGNLTGYAGGLDRKRFLLQLEGVSVEG